MKKILSLFFTFVFLTFACVETVLAADEMTERERQVMSELDSEDDYLDEVSPIIADPLEGWNKAIFHFNDVLLDYAARPLYRGYSYITPDFFRTGVSNFFHNLLFPVRFANNLLQGRGKAAGVEMSRFILNTTAGVGGIIDVAQHKKSIVPVEDEDLGQTFGVWGMGEGFYLVLPLLGSSSARDGLGLVGDFFINPTTYIGRNSNSYKCIALSAKGFGIFNDLDEVLDLYDDMKRASVDPYYAVRDAYVQYRRAQIKK